MIRRLLAAGLALALVGTQDARATAIEGVQFAPQVSVGDAPLALHGTGLLRYRVVIKAYVAALYLEPDTPGEAVLGDVPKRLEIEYFWGIPGEAFGRTADAFLARTLEPAQLEQLAPRLAALNRLYRDVEPGDRYALTYRPGVGTELALNGRPLGVVPGADFARAYFGIWLGEEPIDAALRRQLLPRS